MNDEAMSRSVSPSPFVLQLIIAMEISILHDFFLLNVYIFILNRKL